MQEEPASGRNDATRLSAVTVVCLPHDAARAEVGSLPDTVEVHVWSGRDAAPEGVERTQFLVPEFGWADAERLRAQARQLPELAVVQVISAGVDSIIAGVPDGVTLCDGRGIHGSSTSEWALAAILASLREIPRFVLAAQEHRWDQGVTDELAGKRVLVVGAGDLGENLARRLTACDAQPTLVARSARDGVRTVAELPVLLPDFDIVVLMVPLTEQTTGMVDAEFLAAMADGSLLVNAARGQVVVTDALLAELQRGRLRAALDVTDPEPLPPEHPLWAAPGLLLTPHVGGAVPGLSRRAYALVREQILRFDAGEPLHNVVTGDY